MVRRASTTVLQSSHRTGKDAAFKKDWTLLESRLSERELALHSRPENFDTMVHVAKDLSADFDFVRVDLYTVDGKVYFGELTCTPNRGFGLIDNQERQRMRDEMWHLDAENPLLYRAPKSHRFTEFDIASCLCSQLPKKARARRYHAEGSNLCFESSPA